MKPKFSQPALRVIGKATCAVCGTTYHGAEVHSFMYEYKACDGTVQHVCHIHPDCIPRMEAINDDGD